MSRLPAVVSIGYSRSQTLRKSLFRLSQCHGVMDHDCYLYLDAPFQEEDCLACDKMYAVALEAKKRFLPNLQIVRREKNYGVPGNLISAISLTLASYGKVVFFEDDVLVSRTFLSFMDAALKLYENDARIFCINGYQFPYLRIPKDYPLDVYLNPRNMAWGFGIWEDRWSKVDFAMTDWPEFKRNLANMEQLVRAGEDLPGMIESQLVGDIHTWDVQCTYYMVKNGLYAVEPRYGMTKNIGFGAAAGVHCGTPDPVLANQRYYNFMPKLRADLQPDRKMLSLFQHSVNDFRIHGRIRRKLKRLLNIWSSPNDEPFEVG